MEFDQSEEQTESEKAEQTAASLAAERLKTVMQTHTGRCVLFSILEMCHVYQTSFTGNSATFFKEGERNIGLRLIADMIEADEDSYFQMLREKRG